MNEPNQPSPFAIPRPACAVFKTLDQCIQSQLMLISSLLFLLSCCIVSSALFRRHHTNIPNPIRIGTPIPTHTPMTSALSTVGIWALAPPADVFKLGYAQAAVNTLLPFRDRVRKGFGVEDGVEERAYLVSCAGAGAAARGTCGGFVYREEPRLRDRGLLSLRCGIPGFGPDDELVLS